MKDKTVKNPEHESIDDFEKGMHELSMQCLGDFDKLDS